jgi:hypothetical protein
LAVKGTRISSHQTHDRDKKNITSTIRTTTSGEETHNAQINYTATSTGGREPGVHQSTSGDTPLATTIAKLATTYPYGRKRHP